MNIKKALSNKVPVEHPPQYLEVVHCDIGFGASLLVMEPCIVFYLWTELLVTHGFTHLNHFFMSLLNLPFNNGFLIVGGVLLVFILTSVQKFWRALQPIFFMKRMLFFVGLQVVVKTKLVLWNGHGKQQQIWLVHSLLICRCLKVFGIGPFISPYKS